MKIFGHLFIAGLFVAIYFVIGRVAFWISPWLGWPVSAVLALLGFATVLNTFLDVVKLLRS